MTKARESLESSDSEVALCKDGARLVSSISREESERVDKFMTVGR